MNAALQADAQAGSTSTCGVDQLEATIANQGEKLLMNKGSSLNDKLNQCCAAFERWVVFEPGMSLTSSHDLLTVAKHTTFGRLKAQVLMSSCICPDAWKGSVVKPNPQCALHAEEVSLTDVLFEIIQVVHDVFPDDFMCFAHLITSRTVEGGYIGKCFFFSQTFSVY